MQIKLYKVEHMQQVNDLSYNINFLFHHLVAVKKKVV